MHADAGYVFLGLAWSAQAMDGFRLAQPEYGAGETLLPAGNPLRYRVSHPGERTCCGWFDLTGAAAVHVNCETWEVVAKGTQCARCQFAEGFITAHQSHRRDVPLPENVRAHMGRPHFLYTAVFADGAIKVGTAVETRKSERLAEQGPVAAYYIARASNGQAIRVAEDIASAQGGLRQTVSRARKLAALTRSVDTIRYERELEAATRRVRSVLAAENLSGTVELFAEPVPWRRPRESDLLFDRTPLVEYPEDLAQGQHSLFIRAMAGPVAAFSITSTTDESDMYAADLSVLRGVRIEFGNYWSQARPTQSALF